MNDTVSYKSFYEGLVANRLIIPTDVLGTYGRGPLFEDVLYRFNDLVNRITVDDQAEFLAFPPVVDRKIMEKVHYLHTFPQLCGSQCTAFLVMTKKPRRFASVRIWVGNGALYCNRQMWC